MLDEHIEFYTTQALINESGVSADRIEVESDSGKVTLRGEVQTFGRKLKAAETAKKCDGVESVINNLNVVPADPKSDLNIARSVNDSLASRANLKEHAIRVDVSNGVVTLSGYASNPQAKKKAEDLAVGIAGVREVSNFLVVNADRVLRNHELSVSILTSARRIIGMEDADIRLSVVDEMARLSGMVDEVWKKESAEDTVRSFGIIKICNDIAVQP
ncbi:MAG: BON domain-containing protein [Planctomycetota bacterium]